MDLFIQITQFLLSLSILIVLHEMGHFLPAKLFGMRVEKFYLFFDYKFSLIKKFWKGTEYGIGWIPLGGYVKISGMIDESMDKEQMAKEPEEWEFRSKPAWQRLIVMIGGVTVNVIVAIVIYIGLSFHQGKTYTPIESLEGGIEVRNPLATELFGLQTGDVIETIDGNPAGTMEELTLHLITAKQITIIREGDRMTLPIPEDVVGELSERKHEVSTLFGMRLPFVVGAVAGSGPNADVEIGYQDRLIAIDGQSLNFIDQVKPVLKEKAGQEIVATFVDLENKSYDQPLRVNEEGLIGVQLFVPQQLEDFGKQGFPEVIHEEYTLGEAIPAGIGMAWDKLYQYYQQFKLVLNPSSGAYKGLGGFKTMTKLFRPTWDWIAFWNLTALFSIMLAFMNILPIPALDGGHVVFLLYEMVTGRKPHQKVLEIAQVVGFVILMSLLLIINGKELLESIF